MGWSGFPAGPVTTVDLSVRPHSAQDGAVASLSHAFRLACDELTLAASLAGQLENTKKQVWNS
jgi:hypothetical protein